MPDPPHIEQYEPDQSQTAIEFTVNSTFFKRSQHLIGAVVYAKSCAFHTVAGAAGSGGPQGLRVTCYPFDDWLEKSSVTYYPPKRKEEEEGRKKDEKNKVIVLVTKSEAVPYKEGTKENRFSLIRMKCLSSLAAITSSATIKLIPDHPLCIQFQFSDKGPIGEEYHDADDRDDIGYQATLTDLLRQADEEKRKAMEAMAAAARAQQAKKKQRVMAETDAVTRAEDDDDDTKKKKKKKAYMQFIVAPGIWKPAEDETLTNS
jgi:hypothetical protein